MRSALCALLVLTAACAGQPVSAPVSTSVLATASSPQRQSASAPAGKSKIDTNALVNAKKLGYSVVNQDGIPMYCRNDLKTGSRVEREIVCLTAAQIDDLRQLTQKRLSDVTRQSLPPPSR